MAMPSHGELVSRERELRERVEALEAAQGPATISVPSAGFSMDDRALFLVSALCGFVAGQFGDPHNAFLNPEMRPEDMAVNAYTAAKRALSLYDSGMLEKQVAIAARVAEDTQRRHQDALDRINAPAVDMAASRAARRGDVEVGV